ncbi:MAG: stage V sporulation protein AD [Gracilibacter sp. BRH_c7a]|nr:MAG: stage V sporulation protein AD [Gracilibacter sp. BRH_c7a]
MVNKNLRPPTLNVTPEEYKKMTAQISPRPTLIKNVVLAFLIGGLICSIGQIFINFYIIYGGLPKLAASTAGTATLIVIGATLTGIGIYDDIVKVGGAGAIIPVTGFANSMVSPALEYKKEGYVFGIGAKLFSIAGPVLVYGISSSIFVGLIYYLLDLLR